MNLLHRLWNRRPWGYAKTKDDEMLVGREVLPIPLGKVVVEARRVRPTAMPWPSFGRYTTKMPQTRRAKKDSAGA